MSYRFFISVSIKFKNLKFGNVQQKAYFSSMYKLKHFIEWQVFGVLSAIGSRMGIATSKIRLWFIYISFLTLGSPLIIYMILAFWRNMRNYVCMSKRNPLRNL